MRLPTNRFGVFGQTREAPFSNRKRVISANSQRLAVAEHKWKKKGRIDRIILYVNCARGGWTA